MDPIIEKESRFLASNYHPLPIVLTRGEGVYLWDNHGTRYIDMMSAYSAVSHGHSNPRLLDVLYDQARRLCVTSRAFHTENMGPFVERLCSISGMDKALPMNTGAEAVETAIKAARRWGYRVKGIEKDKAEIIVAQQNFHGRTTTITGFSSSTESKEDFGPFTPGFVSIPFNDAAALEAAITPQTCAFIVEPIQGEGGIIIPAKGWLARVQEICKKHNVLLILDEVQTGLGRTGKMFAFQHEIDVPDGLIVGKALGGGILPVSAFLGNRQVMDLFTPGSHGSTFGGNPLACAIALEAINILEDEKLVENSLSLGEYFQNELKKIKTHLIKEVRGRGLWIGLEINPEKAMAREVCERLMVKGLLTKETRKTVLRLAPPLIITRDIIDEVVTIIDETLDEVEYKK